MLDSLIPPFVDEPFLFKYRPIFGLIPLTYPVNTPLAESTSFYDAENSWDAGDEGYVIPNESNPYSPGDLLHGDDLSRIPTANPPELRRVSKRRRSRLMQLQREKEFLTTALRTLSESPKEGSKPGPSEEGERWKDDVATTRLMKESKREVMLDLLKVSRGPEVKDASGIAFMAAINQESWSWRESRQTRAVLPTDQKETWCHESRTAFETEAEAERDCHDHRARFNDAHFSDPINHDDGNNDVITRDQVIRHDEFYGDITTSTEQPSHLNQTAFSGDGREKHVVRTQWPDGRAAWKPFRMIHHLDSPDSTDAYSEADNDDVGPAHHVVRTQFSTDEEFWKKTCAWTGQAEMDRGVRWRRNEQEVDEMEEPHENDYEIDLNFSQDDGNRNKMKSPAEDPGLQIFADDRPDFVRERPAGKSFEEVMGSLDRGSKSQEASFTDSHAGGAFFCRRGPGCRPIENDEEIMFDPETEEHIATSSVVGNPMRPPDDLDVSRGCVSYLKSDLATLITSHEGNPASFPYSIPQIPRLGFACA